MTTTTTITKELKNLDNFTVAYLTAALWTSTDEDDTPLDSKFSLKNIDVDNLLQVKNDCVEFQSNNRSLLDKSYKTLNYTDTSAGHDFWLTRNGHGAGYWDRGLENIGEQLTKAAKDLKESDLYVGDDGKLHFTNLPFHRKQIAFKF